MIRLSKPEAPIASATSTVMTLFDPGHRDLHAVAGDVHRVADTADVHRAVVAGDRLVVLDAGDADLTTGRMG